MTVNGASVWLAREQVRLQTSSPRTWGRLQAALRYRVALMVGVSAVTGGLTQQRLSVDPALFARAAHQLFTANGLDVFHDPTLQIGPLYLLALAFLGAIADVLHLSPVFVDGAVQAGGLVWLCVYLVRLYAPVGSIGTTRDIGIGTCLMFGPIGVVAMYGHLEEPLIAALFLLAAHRAAEGKNTSTALLLVLTTGIKLTGLLGLPILLIAAGPAVLARRLSIFVVAVAGCYLPFFLFGVVNTFQYSWVIQPSASLGFLLDEHPFTWQLRILQGLCAGLGGSWLAWRKEVPLWAVPAGIIALRLLLDPTQFGYYWTGFILCVAVGFWSAPKVNWSLVWPAVVIGDLIAVSLSFIETADVDRYLRSAALAVILCLLFRRWRPAYAGFLARPTLSRPDLAPVTG